MNDAALELCREPLRAEGVLVGHARRSTEEPREPAFGVHRVAASPGICRLDLRGELDLHAAPSLQATLDDLNVAQDERLVLDVSHLRFIDCSSLRVLSAYQQTLRQRPALLQPPPFLCHLLHLVGLTDAFEVISRKDDASNPLAASMN